MYTFVFVSRKHVRSCKIHFFKTLMRRDFDNPAPIPEDLFLANDVDVDHGYFMAGTKGTG